MPRHLPKDVEPFPGPQSAENGLCAWKGCNKAGEYPAPKDRSLMERYMFCLDHVRAYNAQWDFHRGLSGAQLEAELQGPATWGRPTWKLGSLGSGLGGRHKPWNGTFRAHDPFGLGADTAFDPRRRRRDQEAFRGPPGPNAEYTRALKFLGLSPPVTLEILRRRYKVLVKIHHPDANGGSPEAEMRMKRINAAYQVIRTSLMTAA